MALAILTAIINAQTEGSERDIKELNATITCEINGELNPLKCHY